LTRVKRAGAGRAYLGKHRTKGTIMKPHWILVANATEARLLQREPGTPLVVLQAFHHPEGRSSSAELGDDKAGRDLSGHGFGSAAYQPRLDAHRKEHLHFARELAGYLEQAATQQRYETLALCASSPFLGELKQALGDGAQRRLAETHDVDLTHFGVGEIEQRLAGASSAR
jgi:protein required for attachment to host cells